MIYCCFFLSFSISVTLSLSLTLTLSLSLPHSLCLTLSLSPSLSIPHSLSPSPSLFFLLQIKLKCLKSELQRRPVYYYPTIEQCQEKLKQLDARQTLLEKKESKYRKEKIIRKSKLFFSDVFLIFVILIDLPNNYERVWLHSLYSFCYYISSPFFLSVSLLRLPLSFLLSIFASPFLFLIFSVCVSLSHSLCLRLSLSFSLSTTLFNSYSATQSQIYF